MPGPGRHTADDRPLALSLALLRLSTGVFFLVWALEKIVAPEIARRVYETFYFSSPSDTMLLITGLVQAAVVLVFMAGLFRFWTYGALLVMHGVSVVSSSGRLFDPFTPPNHLILGRGAGSRSAGGTLRFAQSRHISGVGPAKPPAGITLERIMLEHRARVEPQAREGKGLP